MHRVSCDDYRLQVSLDTWCLVVFENGCLTSFVHDFGKLDYLDWRERAVRGIVIFQSARFVEWAVLGPDVLCIARGPRSRGGPGEVIPSNAKPVLTGPFERFVVFFEDGPEGIEAPVGVARRSQEAPGHLDRR